MGTSKRWVGADGAGVWPTGSKALDAWSRTVKPDCIDGPMDDCGMSEDDARAIGTAYLDDLRRTVGRDPDADPLREALLSAGSRLPAAIEHVSADVLAIVADVQSGISTDRLAALTDSFITALHIGPGTLPNAILRRGAAEALRDALRRMSDDQRAESGSRESGPFERSLFCLLYRLFFAHAVAQAVTTVIAEKIKLAVPVLYVLDPAGVVATWAAKHLFALLPNPCEAKIDDGGDLKSVGEDLVQESVNRAFSTNPSAPTAAAAS
jgi:hypothetical protein